MIGIQKHAGKVRKNMLFEIIYKIHLSNFWSNNNDLLLLKQNHFFVKKRVLDSKCVFKTQSRHLLCRQMHAVVLQFTIGTDYGRPERKQPSLHGRKFNPNPRFLGTTEAYFVCQIGPIFQISLIYAFIGCPQSVHTSK